MIMETAMNQNEKNMHKLVSAMFEYGLIPHTSHSPNGNSIVYKFAGRRFPTVVSLNPESDGQVTVVVICSPETRDQNTAVFRVTIDAACVLMLAMINVEPPATPATPATNHVSD